MVRGPDASTVTYNVQYADGVDFAEDSSYTFALPSANFSYWLVPDQLQLRAAGGETMSRPDLNQLAPNSTNQATNGTPIIDQTGSAGLKPIKAWNFDLSAEWYYQPHAALTFGVFGKKVTDDIYTNATKTLISAPSSTTVALRARCRGYPSLGPSLPRRTAPRQPTRAWS